MSFLTEYFSIESEKTEAAVCCPFTHYTENGMPYLENNPSAHVNIEEGLFHCKVCGAKGNEVQMIEKLLECNKNAAHKIQKAFNTSEDVYEWDKEALNDATKTRAMGLGISEEVITELKLKTELHSKDNICFPVFMFGHLLDIRTYNPGGDPKIRSRFNSPSGLIIPFDNWETTPKTQMTIICAGEKDMAIARNMGFNAITITGGENALPSQSTYFKNRHIAICYDNDTAGKVGAYKLAKHLSKYTSVIKVITNFHEGMLEKEDITDYFIKYKHTKLDLINCIETTELFCIEDADEEQQRNYPIMDLLDASKPENLNKTVRSNVQIEAISEQTFSCASHISAEKFKAAENDKMQEGEIREWELTDDTAINILRMIDNNIKEENLKLVYKDLMHIMRNEKFIKIEEIERVTVFKCFLTDMYETTDTTQNTQPMEYVAYSINQKLESGQKYLITHRIVPHPNKGQQLVMLIMHAEQANDSVSQFEITEDVISSLKTIQNIPGDLQTKIETLTEKVKGLLGYNGINKLIQAVDFAYHTPLQFNFGNFKNVRAYLDTIIVGESRTGKSSTASALREVYQLGTFTSLAGNSSTIPGLVGGSNKTASGYQTKAGIIPQNHKGLIIFEEFGKCNQNVVKELTDIRSSNEVRITRVAGTITLPAMVRMVSLTNPKAKDGNIQAIAAYPNGIEVLKDLIETAEDIARYDLIVILPDRGNSQIDPLWTPEEPLDSKVYKDRIRWIWSRNAEQIIIDNDTKKAIVNTANSLNKEYDGHIKIFGTEAWKKLTRLAIAIAGYVCSTDDTFENIVVTTEHVYYAAKYLSELYDNPTFKLREYINYEKQFTEIDQEGIANLQDIYDRNPMIILQLEQCSTTNKNILMAATGMEPKEINGALNRLTKGLFIKFKNHDIIPTERFRKGLSKINRNTYAPRLGEINAEIPMGSVYDLEFGNFYNS